MLSVRLARPDEYSAALRLLFDDLDETARNLRLAVVLDQLGDGLAPQLLLVAVRDDQLVGAGWVSPAAGKTGLLQMPRLIPGEDLQTADVILAALNDAVAEADVQLVQAMLTSDQSADRRQLEEHGYDLAADLHYLSCQANHFPRSLPQSELTYRRAQNYGEAEFCRLIERTYIDSLDCPMLDGMRDMADVLEGYRATGTHDPSLWLIAQVAEQTVGCLLLTKHLEHNYWELIYMGVVPEARGNGWGYQITQQALWLAQQARQRMVVLGIDSQNEPARAAYRRAGFEKFEQRLVMLQVSG